SARPCAPRRRSEVSASWKRGPDCDRELRTGGRSSALPHFRDFSWRPATIATGFSSRRRPPVWCATPSQVRRTPGSTPSPSSARKRSGGTWNRRCPARRRDVAHESFHTVKATINGETRELPEGLTVGTLL